MPGTVDPDPRGLAGRRAGGQPATSANVTWETPAVGRERRWEALGQQGATLWFTGLPGSGKSTVAAAVEARLVESGRGAYRLDGDNMRHGICGDLGFTRKDREANVWRVGEVARLFADSGSVAVVALVSPYARCRERVRRRHEDDGLIFLEVFLNTSPEECARRDPKGLYARAQRGEVQRMTGVDDPYEAPVAPDLELTPDCPPEAAADAVLLALDHRLAGALASRPPVAS
ncbi:MAG TPA: adenylyl-sulfate kinase [Solirubrobacteraceae bacterium]|nr:adenylyl-sulfate kinase [Solirubrobacteraceae bacterium]